MAFVYEQELSNLGLSISYSKSFLSHSGSAEFAKRFRVKNLTVDLSPVSAKALLSAHRPIRDKTRMISSFDICCYSLVLSTFAGKKRGPHFG